MCAGSFNLNNGSSSLQTLSAFQSVVTIGGDFNISNNAVLTQLPSLNALTTVGGSITITYNPVLQNVNALSSLTTINGQIYITFNDQLTSLTGLNNISSNTITNWSLQYNPLLATCNIPSVCSYLANGGYGGSIYGNAIGCADVTQILALCNPGCPSGDLYFSTQAEVDAFATNYPSCSSLNGGITISGPDITNLNALSGITSVLGNLSIYNNSSLPNLIGLDNLIIVHGSLQITNNDLLTNMNGLSNLVSVSGNININDNDGIVSLVGLGNLTHANGGFSISNNLQLLNLNGLNAFHSADNLSITSNS